MLPYYITVCGKLQSFFLNFGKFGEFGSAPVLKFQVVQAHQVAVPDAHVLQAVEQAAFPQHPVKPVAALIVAEIGVGDEPLEPGTLHQVYAVLHRDFQRLADVDLGG